MPYEIKLPPRDINVRVSSTNSARRFVLGGVYDGNLHALETWEWTKEPETLRQDDVYARLSAAEAVKAFFDSFTNSDWEAMKKVAPGTYVENIKQNFVAAEKSGRDPRKMLTMDVGEAVWFRSNRPSL